PRKGLAEGLPGQSQPRVDRAERYRQSLTRLLPCHAFDLEQDKDASLFRRHRIQDRFQDRQSLVRLRGAVNVAPQVDLRLDLSIVLNLVPVMDVTTVIARDAAADGEEPGRQRATPFEVFQVA